MLLNQAAIITVFAIFAFKTICLMHFDTNNPIVQLCAQGMQLEGEGKPGEAKELFYKAWTEAANPFEQFTAAHYVARHQQTVQYKLHWDEKCLQLALGIGDDNMRATYPSLYLNVGKCHEDLGNKAEALDHYRKAKEYTTFLGDDGYSNMIKAGIEKGLQRLL